MDLQWWLIDIIATNETDGKHTKEMLDVGQEKF